MILCMKTMLNLIGFVAASYLSSANAKESTELLSAVEAALPSHVGACVMATDNGRVVFEHGYGVADVESKMPCTPETNFRMASVSKQFTATAVMLLVDRRTINLDDK